MNSEPSPRAFRPSQITGDRRQHDRYRDDALTGRFWNGAIQNYWNEIAQTASVAHNLTTAENARLFALLNLSFADGVITFYDAKYGNTTPDPSYPGAHAFISAAGAEVLTSFSPAMAQGPQLSGGSSWPGIPQRVDPSARTGAAGVGTRAKRRKICRKSMWPAWNGSPPTRSMRRRVAIPMRWQPESWQH
jgi:hypothetical protein